MRLLGAISGAAGDLTRPGAGEWMSSHRDLQQKDSRDANLASRRTIGLIDMAIPAIDMVPGA